MDGVGMWPGLGIQSLVREKSKSNRFIALQRNKSDWCLGGSDENLPPEQQLCIRGDLMSSEQPGGHERGVLSCYVPWPVKSSAT